MTAAEKTSQRRLDPKTTLAMSIINGGKPEVIPGQPDQVQAFCHLEKAGGNGRRPDKTLRINITTGRFYCRVCSRDGDPAAMLAMTWGMSAADAMAIAPADLRQLTRTRPKVSAKDLQPARQRPDEPVVLQNTAALNVAYRYYRNNVSRERPYRYLMELGVNNQVAAKCGIGYAARSAMTGLHDHLLSHGVSSAEIGASRLTNGPGNKYDYFSGQLTLADFDRSGAVVWYAGTPASAPPNADHPWLPDLPVVKGLMGRRPFMVGTAQKPWHPETLVITDDVRLWIIVRCHQTQAPVWLSDRRTGEDAPRLAELVGEADPRRLVIAMHHEETGAAYRDVISEVCQTPDLSVMTKTRMMRFVDARRYGRDWSILGNQTMTRIHREIREDRKREQRGQPTKLTPDPRLMPRTRRPVQIKTLEQPAPEPRIERGLRRLSEL